MQTENTREANTAATIIRTPFGFVKIGCRDGAVALIERTSRKAAAKEPALTSPCADAAAQLAEYFRGERREFSLPLELRGTEFQLDVWRALRSIPYGETRTYAQIAAAIGRPKAARAVGMANKRNPLPVIVPCHRVVNADGRLGGYSGGLDMKKWLLDMERRTNGAFAEAAVGFGSNLGDRLAHLREALERLSAIDGVELDGKSGIYETEPVGVPAEFSGLAFLNAVAIFRVRLGVEAWSAAVHAVEDAMLRVRGKTRNTPRTIDLDLLYFGDVESDTPELRLPHPQCTSRRFVCAPLCELRPKLVLPGETRTIAQILATLPERPGAERLDGGW